MNSTVLAGIMIPFAGTALAAGLVIPAMPYLLSFAAGAMMYVVVEELISFELGGLHFEYDKVKRNRFMSFQSMALHILIEYHNRIPFAITDFYASFQLTACFLPITKFL